MDSFRLSDLVIEWVDGSIRVYYSGMVIARLEYEDTAQVRWIWTDPGFRRNGVAKMMLAEVERRTGKIAHPLPPVSECARGLFR